MDNLFTLATALQFAEEGKIEEWIHLFLNCESNNVPFSEGLRLEKRFFIPPVKMPLNQFTRCCGPEKYM